MPKLPDRLRLDKPPLIYWLQAGCAALVERLAPGAVVGTHAVVWPMRLPSVLGATAAALLTYVLGRRLFAGPTAALAGALLGCCVVVVADARQARADQVLLALIVLAQLALWQVWNGARHGQRVRRAWPALFWLAVALGVLTKGPIAPAVCGATVLGLCVLTRSWGWVRELRPVAGALGAVALVAAWVVPLIVLTGWEPLAGVLWREVLVRGALPREGHWGPPGYHALLAPLLFWPGSLLLLAGLGWGMRRGVRGSWRAAWRLRAGRPAEAFCLAWLVPGWLMFELAGTKLPHYVLPMYPALALLAARAAGALSGRRGGRLPLQTAGLMMWVVMGGAWLVAVPLAGRLAGLSITWGSGAVLLAATLAGGAAMFVAVCDVVQRRAVRAAWVGCAAMIACGVTVFQVVLPGARDLWLSDALAAELHRLDPATVRPLADTGHREDSLVYLTRGRVQRLRPGEAPAWLAAHGGALLICDAREVPDGATVLAGVSGWNITRGRWVRLAVVEFTGE